MQYIRTRNDLIKWLEENAPRKAIGFAMTDGEIELLGVFSPVPGNCGIGWIVKVTSKHGLSWNVVITINKYIHKYYAYTIKTILWKDYSGGGVPIFAGDDPDVYKELKKKSEVKDE